MRRDRSLAAITRSPSGKFALDEMEVQPDASGNMNIVGAHEIAVTLFYVDELAVDLWASLDAAIYEDTDEAADPNNPGRRSYECAQIVGPQ